VRGGDIMDWLIGMNNVLDYVEENITENIDYDKLSKMVCCSTYTYKRNENVQHLEVFGPENASLPDYKWEIWIPVLEK
jgi:hypothetical protein